MDNPNTSPSTPVPQTYSREQSVVPATQINELATKLKLLEERYNILRKKSQLNEQNIVEMDKEQFSELKLLQKDLLETKKQVRKLTEELSGLTDEVRNFVRRHEFLVLKRYVDLWQPVDFVTRKEVNSFLRSRFKKN